MLQNNILYECWHVGNFRMTICSPTSTWHSLKHLQANHLPFTQGLPPTGEEGTQLGQLQLAGNMKKNSRCAFFFFYAGLLLFRKILCSMKVLSTYISSIN